MEKITVAKFGGSTIGAYGIGKEPESPELIQYTSYFVS